MAAEPLLGAYNGGAAKCDEEEFLTLDGKEIWVEAKQQIWIAAPMVGVNLVQFSVQLVSVMFVGHLGKLQLSSASIASSICNVTGFSFLIGLAAALETLCGQAYGAKQYHMLAVYMKRAILILMLFSIPIAVLWLNMEHVLLFFDQAPEIASRAGEYTRYLIPALFSYVFLQPLIKFLQSQSLVIPMFICSCATIAIHVLLCWTLVYRVSMGAKGAALSSSICLWLNVLFLISCVKLSPKSRRYFNLTLSRQIFQDLSHFMKLAVPSAVMCCLEWWSFEALILLSGTLPNPELEASVFSILLNIISTTFMIPFGIGIAASTRVANMLGAGKPLAARLSFRTSLALALADGLVVSSALFLLRNKLGWIFSSEPEVVNYVARMIPFLVCMEAVDAIQGVLSGVARGCGWQALGVYINFGAYYALGLPIGYVLAVVFKFKGEGLLIGILCGVITQATMFVIICLCTNWTKQAETATERLSHDTQQLLH